MEEWEVARCQAKEETNTILKIGWGIFYKFLKAKEIRLCIKYEDEFVLILVFTLEHHLYSVLVFLLDVSSHPFVI